MPDSISRSVGPCRSSQSDLDMENPFLHAAALCTTRLYTSIYQSRTVKAGSHPQSDCDGKKVPKPGGFGMKFPAVSRAGIEEERCFKARPLKILTECLVLDCV